ncbi:hypothetical protein NL676_020927 [Syzygium grande]|nr:hypothetical protein NL676_020927 [Syzygium grande]
MLSFAVVVAPVLLFVIADQHLREEKSDVFLSFGGEGAPMDFADSLYEGLVNAQICVTGGDDWLCRGKKIGRDRVQAIKNSKILIPILSPSYATGRCSLDELVVEERKRRALTEVCSLKGWESEKVANGDEGQLVELVIRKVLIELKKALEPVITENLVSFDSRGYRFIFMWKESSIMGKNYKRVARVAAVARFAKVVRVASNGSARDFEDSLSRIES